MRLRTPVFLPLALLLAAPIAVAAPVVTSAVASYSNPAALAQLRAHDDAIHGFETQIAQLEATPRPASKAPPAAMFQRRMTEIDEALARTQKVLAYHQETRAKVTHESRAAVAEHEQKRDALIAKAPVVAESFTLSSYARKKDEIDSQIGNYQRSIEATEKAWTVEGPRAGATLANAETALQHLIAQGPSIPVAHGPSLTSKAKALVGMGPLAAQYQRRIDDLGLRIKDEEGWSARTPLQPGETTKMSDEIVAELRVIKGALTQRGPAGYDARFADKLEALGNEVLQAKRGIVHLEQEKAQQVPRWRAELTRWQKERDAHAAMNPEGYHPEYDANLARLEATTEDAGANLAQHRGSQGYEQNEKVWEKQIASAQAQKARLTEHGPGNYNPHYLGRIAQIDTSIVQLKESLDLYAPHPQYSQRLSDWGQEIAQLKQEKARIVKNGPKNYNPPFEDQLARLLRDPRSSSQRLRADLLKLGPTRFTPVLEQQLGWAAQGADGAKARLRISDAQLQPHVDIARDEVAHYEALKSELSRHGEAKYNPEYEKRWIELDRKLGTLSGELKHYTAFEQRDARAQIEDQIAQTEKLKAALVAAGPDHYDPNQLQILELRNRIDEMETSATPLRLQLHDEGKGANGNQRL